MISVKNQYVCKLDIGDYKDFVHGVDLIELLYVEDSAMRLPVIEISFILRNPDVLNYLNEGSVLTVGLGQTEISMLDLKFRITTDLSEHKPSIGQTVFITGILDVEDFINTQKYSSYQNLSSLEVVKNVAKKHFSKFKTNLSTTNDVQTWQQAGTDWNFLKNVCASGYYNDSTFLVGGFDCDTFYYYDFRKKIQDAAQGLEPLYILSKNRTGDNVLNYNTARATNSSTATAKVVGYNNANVEYNWLDYSIQLYKDNLQGFASLETNKLPIKNDVNIVSYIDSGFNDSDIKNIALTNNTRNMLLNSNINIFVTTGGQFKRLHLFDIVLFDETSDYRLCGLSTITRVAYQITQSQLFTNITLVRESFNGLSGDLQSVGK